MGPALRFLSAAALCTMMLLAPACSDDDPAGPITHETLASGNGTWEYDGCADLETGAFNGIPDGSSDFYYSDEPPGISSTIPLTGGAADSGARLAYLGLVVFDDVTWDQVSAASMTDHLAPSSGAYQAGAVIGYKTDEGRYGKLKIVSKDTTTNDLTVSYLTWE